jgi:hypothetical protein
MTAICKEENFLDFLMDFIQEFCHRIDFKKE